MYHQHSQQQGSQSFSNGSRPTHHQPSPNQNRPPSDMLSQAMGFQFPRPTQLPDELESALAIRGARDMDHRLIDHMSRPNQNQSSGSGIGQHGTYSSNPALTSDNQTSHQQGVDWSTYQPPTKLFASPPPSAGHQSQRHQGPQQQAQNSHGGTSISSWTASASDSPSPQARHPLAGGSGGGGGDGQGLYTPESAGSILASFGLSNEDLEVLSHYPDDQLTPDTLPFILRDIQINKSGNKTAASTSSSTFSSSIHEMPLPPSRSSPLARSHSPEVPSLLTVTQTAGKVIDYGHASRAKDQSDTRETFKRERLSGERTVKMYPSSASSSTTKVDKTERRQVRLEHTESSKHGDRDYRRTSNDHRKNHRSPGREFPPLSKSHNLDQDYRRDGPKSRPSSETRSEASSRRSLSSSSGSKLHSSSKKLPTPTMISDFSAVSPKVYPHTCSLCHIQCDQEKDWVDHINTVNHTAACRDLRNKYPDWKPNLPSRSGRYGSRALWDPKDQSPSHSVSRSLSYSPSPSPPHSKLRVGPHPPRPHGRPYSPHHHPRNQRYPGGPSRGGVKRPLNDSVKFSASIGRHPSSSKAVHGSKHGPPSSARSFKSGTKPGAKTPKTASSKAADTSAKPPPAKKKKKMSTPASKDSSVANRLVYLTGIPEDASEQDITDLVGSFGKINNVILMPCSEEERKKGQGQKASVCMVKAEDAQALASSTNLSIRDQEIIASVAKKPLEKAAPSSDADNSKPAPGQDKGTAAEDAGGEANQKTSDEKAMVLITGLPESGWSESDIIKLIQPFGTPSDIILATQIGKALVTVPDVEIVEEMVKVHAFVPLKIKDCELKIVHLKQCICLSKPVALYNLLMGSGDPLENPAPVGWSSLLVINNVPSTPSGPSEVQKLVRRFGTVIKTLVLNSMVICEMATAAMALSVYKRFQTFPCIIHNNPLFFSRKPDPKNNPQTKVITAYLDSSEDAHVKGSQTTAAAADVDAGSLMVKDGKRKDEKTTSAEKTADHEASVENRNKDKLTESVSDSAAASEAKPDADVETDVRETSEVESVAENKDVDVSKAGNDSTPAGGEMKTSSSDGKAASQEMDMPELPKVTPEMVSALLVECRTRTAGHPNNPAAAANGEQEAAQTEAKQGRKAGKESPTNPAEEEEAKRQERERKEREARKEKERKERERRAREKEERAKKERERNERARRERERREEERREWERRERERRGRKRSYGEGMSDLRSSYKQSSWKDEHRNNSGARTVEEDEDFDEFPFNMSDFVTVDEVGDVADLPMSPSSAVPMDTTEGEDVPSSVQNDASGDVSTEVTTETRTSDTTGTQQKSESEPEPASEPTADTSGGLVSSGLSSGADFTAAASPASQSAPTCQPEAPETETTLTAEVEPSPTPAPAVTAASSDGPETGVVTAKSEEEEKESQAKVEEVVSDTTENHKKIQDEEDKETEAPAEETGKNESSEEQTDSVEDKVKKPKKETSTDCLPPFNPSNPVGMEFLVPKTGFFCKVCNRFFSGSREAEISHCKTLKHYENLQKHLKTIKTVNPAAKPESS